MNSTLGDQEHIIMEEVDNPHPMTTKIKIWLRKLVKGLL
jgi:hypothetical protein